MNERNKGKRLENFVSDYVVFDLETTSNKIYDAKIIEIAAIKVRDGKIVDTFESLVNPGEPIPAVATAVNHITDEMVKNAPILEDVLDDLLAFINGEILVGHNITTFDLNILYDVVNEYNGLELQNDFVDTLFLARKCIEGLENYKLEIIGKYYRLDVSNNHRALKDCYLAEECYRRLKKEYEEHGFVRCNKNSSSSCNKNTRYSDETRALQQLQGYLMGIVADDILTAEEIIALNDWMECNIALKGNYPFDRVYESLERVFEDGIIEQTELDDLLVLFKDFISPADKKKESVLIETLVGKHCCLTGEFKYGGKKNFEVLITERGGICDNTVKKITDYVIVGSLGSENWKQGTYGGKIKKAIELQEKGSKVQIVSEESFQKEMESMQEERHIEEGNIEDEMIISAVDITEDNGWKGSLQKMLEELINVWELPDKSLYLAQNIGRISGKVTSYSVCIYEPEYPKISKRKIDQSRNSVVMNIKEKKNGLELIIGNNQYEKVLFDEVLEMKRLKSDKNNVHVLFASNDKRLTEYVKKHTEYRIKHYSSKASTFGCCTKFVACSDAKKCIHENRLYSMACSYRSHLDAGEIFYGKNRNID